MWPFKKLKKRGSEPRWLDGSPVLGCVKESSESVEPLRLVWDDMDTIQRETLCRMAGVPEMWGSAGFQCRWSEVPMWVRTVLDQGIMLASGGRYTLL